MQKTEHIFTVKRANFRFRNSITGEVRYYFVVECSCKLLVVDASEDQVGVIMRIHLQNADRGETKPLETT